MAVLALTAALAACGGDKKQAAAGAGAGGGMPPPEVGVVTVQPGAVPLTTDLPGRLEASRLSQIRARAAGILLKRHFEEGSDV
ncbi:MAG: efflux transporter periplasmic adaptor subunit, partial [Brachymonas sp.]|nr:efflux transporter periplasmic adaptor subunit [Brachymonas sp.]